MTRGESLIVLLVEYLAFLGHQPQKIRNEDYWYLSPLRDERTSSFKVNRNLGVWYDHGTGKGGALIDFGILYHNCSVRYGGAEKLTTEMTKDELAQVSASILKRAKEKAFSKGRPIVFGEGGKVYAEWPDGHIEELKV